MRILTAGESHGECLVSIIEGFPKGMVLEESFINQELKRRASGKGRGARMSIESDTVEIVSGLRNKITLGSPIAMLVRNKDARIFSQSKDNLAPLSWPRPAHADLAGALKYNERDVRNILERSSARETVSRVCVGAVCKQLLSHFNITIAGFTAKLGPVESVKKPANVSEIKAWTKNSPLNCIDKAKEKLMLKEIEKVQKAKDSLGGVVEVWIEGVCPGLGSFMHFDKRLDGRLAQSLVSIPSVKGVEFGLGFEYAEKRGSVSHDPIYYSKARGFYHKSNNSGGIEGGISTGEPIIIKIAAKPIPTLGVPLDSVNLLTKEKGKAVLERADTCVVSSLAVIAESMCAITIAEAIFEKFGYDLLSEIKTNWRAYLKKCGSI
ncbi:MAG: chorismate synthase [Candidatus Omnitrophica bacterium]|nr:chorismate synthase [Candidatus Omnitrophota bacterium]